MALIPLLKEKLINTEHIVIDAKSGTSGAGRSPKDSTNFLKLLTNFILIRLQIINMSPKSFAISTIMLKVMLILVSLLHWYH
jgi:hypothetical protein